MGYFVRSMIIVFGVLGLALIAQPTEAQTPVVVMGLTTVEGDDQVAGTISRTLRTLAGQRDGWAVSDAEVSLAQMVLAHGPVCEDVPNRECLMRIGESFFPDREGLIFFGMMRRRGAGRDDVRFELAVFDVTRERVTHRAVFEERLSDLIIGGNVDSRVGGWLDHLSSAESEFEDTGQPYFDPVVYPTNPVVADHTGLEVAGWSLVGVGVASAIAAMVTGSLTLGMNGDPRFDAYRSSWDASAVDNVCDVAANDSSAEGRYVVGRCGEASTYEILTPLLWTVAALAGATGAVLAWHPWIGSGSAEHPVASLRPAISPSRVGLAFALEF